MKRLFLVLIPVLVLMLATACGRSPSAEQTQATATATEATKAQQQLPFASNTARKSNLASSVSDEAQSGEDALVPTELVIPAGTNVHVRLQNAVSSASSRAGDRFDAVLDQPLVVSGKTVVPKGAAVIGRVVQAKASGRLHNSGYIRLTLASIEINGKTVPVQASSVFAKGANHNRRNAAMIGGGTGAGALIGGLAGGGKGALIGGLVGAGAGTGTAYATGKKDVSFGPERKLSFRLTQPISG